MKASFHSYCPLLAGIILIAVALPVKASPLEVTATDIVTKVYGLSDPSASRQMILKDVADQWGIAPSEEDTGEWLDDAGGELISYRGIAPEISVVVHYYDDDTVSDQEYFFVFPYNMDNWEEANKDQSDFAGALLQELFDVGMNAGVVSPSDFVYEVNGELNGVGVEITLHEESEPSPATAMLMPTPLPLPTTGRFILYVHSIFR